MTDRLTARQKPVPNPGTTNGSKVRGRLIISALFALSMLAQPSFADWQLLGEYSSVSFSSVKVGTITESHRFTGLSGFVSDTGNASVTIDLASVDTGIPIRDERMQKMLFNVAEYPHAIFSSTINISEIKQMKAGTSTRTELKGTLSLHGQTASLTIPVLVTRSSSDTVVVSTTQPVVVSADQFELTGGLDALRQIAGLANITPTVPVSFTLVFARTNQE